MIFTVIDKEGGQLDIIISNKFSMGLKSNKGRLRWIKKLIENNFRASEQKSIYTLPTNDVYTLKNEIVSSDSPTFLVVQNGNQMISLLQFNNTEDKFYVGKIEYIS